jgi:hypothetical protein
MASASPATQADAEAAFAQLGRDVVAPFLAGFVTWLHTTAKRDGVTRLCFLARDGYLLQQAYRTYIPETEQIPHTYMYASRRLFTVAAIEKLDERLLQTLTDDHVTMSVGNYLGRIGLHAERFTEEIRLAGFADATDRVEAGERRKLQRLFEIIGPQLVANAKTERERLKKYAESCADWAGGHVGIVDVGWRGSLQRSLARVLDLPNDAIHGYYVGMHFGASDETAKGYLDESQPRDFLLYRRSVRRTMQVFELILAEPAGSIEGLREENGTFVPIRHEMSALRDRAALSTLQRAALDALEHMRCGEAAGKKLALAALARLLSRPTAAEATLLGDLRHQEGIGECGRCEPLARPGMTLREYALLHPLQLIADLRWSFWRRGFITRLWAGQ